MHECPILATTCHDVNVDVYNVLNNSVTNTVCELYNSNSKSRNSSNDTCQNLDSESHSIVSQNNSLDNEIFVNAMTSISDNVSVNLQSQASNLFHVNSISSNPVSDTQEDPYTQLSNFCKKNSKRMIFSHMNINSLATKFLEIHDILIKGFSDIFFVSETKLDSSFPNAQFHVPSFSTHRIDRNAHGGGLLCYVKDTIPHKSRPDIAINKNGIESLVIQIKDNNINNFFLHIYKPPNVNVNILNHAIESMLNICFQESNNVTIIGDLNVNFLNHPNQLTQVCDSFDLKQIVKGPTCFKSSVNPSLLDLILTNCPRSITASINLPLGISDFHNFISAATKINRPSNEPRTINYRTMKNFDEDIYKQDLEIAPFHVSQIFDDVDDKMWFHNNLLSNIIEKMLP